MKVELFRHSKVSLIDQIYQSFADRIRSGWFEPNSRLPSVRQLAKQLEVSQLTVVKAFTKLDNEGLIVRIQGKGTFVPETLPSGRRSNGQTAVQRTEGQPYQWQLTVEDYLPRAQFGRYYRQQENVINFSVSTIYPRLLPNQYVEQEIHRFFQKEPIILSQYGDIQGDQQLRTELTGYLEEQELSVNPDQMLITNGTHQGIDLVARSFVGPGDVVVTEAPTYPAAIDIFRGRGATIVPVPMDDEGMREDMLADVCRTYQPKVIYTVPTFHNPTGTVMSVKRRKNILDLAIEAGSMIVEDDPWSEVYFDEPAPLPIKAFDDNGHVIYLKGLSKTLVPSCRIGILCAEGTIFNRLLTAKANADLGSPLLTQKVILSLLASPRMREHLQKIRLALTLRRDRVLKLLQRHAPGQISWIHPWGGFNMWLTLPSGVHADELLVFAQKKGVTYLPGSLCYPREPETHHLRLSFSHVSDAELEEGIKRLCEVTSDFLESRGSKGQRPIV